MQFTTDDFRYMARALTLADQGRYTTRPNPRVGAVVVRNGAIVAEGYHARAGAPHAEVLALQDAGDQARGATVYVTLEPCCHVGRTGPCTEALTAAGVARVVAAMEDPNPRVAGKGFAQLREAGIEVASGVLEAEARQLNLGFISRMTRQRPWVRCKIAMSLDGRTAAPTGESQWITGEAARNDVQLWRARSGAIMTGVGTVLADDPSLTVRRTDLGWDPASPPGQPLRVILDTHLRTPPSSRLLRLPGETLIFTGQQNGPAHDALDAAGAHIVAVRQADASGRVDLAAALACLGERQVNDILVEAGPILTGALVASGLADELILYVAPSFLGDTGRGACHLPGLRHLTERHRLRIIDVRAVGDDWRIIAQPAS